MRFDSIKVRGIGPFREEASIDFGALDARLVAIVGENGAGKSTLLELLAGALYRECPTRGPLTGLATSRDAFVEVACVNGKPWTIRQTVDAVSGKGEASVLDAHGAAVLTSAKVREHDAWAAAHLPPPEVLYASTFAVQGRGGFLDMRPAERKAVLLRVLGIERLERMAEAARARAAGARKALDLVIARAGEIGGAGVALAEADVEQHRQDAARADEQVAAARSEASRAWDEAARVADMERQASDASRTRAAIEAKLREARARLADLEARAKNNAGLLARADEIRAGARRADELRTEHQRAEADARLADERAGAANAEDERLARELRDIEARRRTLAERARRAEDVLRGAAVVREAAAQVERLAARVEAAEREERMAYAEIERLRDSRVAGAEERVAKLRETVGEVATWRADCHAHDADMGHEPRDFDEDTVAEIEAFAAAAKAADDGTVERAREVREAWPRAEGTWRDARTLLDAAREELRLASDRASRLPAVESAERDRDALVAERAELEERAAALVTARDEVSDRRRLVFVARGHALDAQCAARMELATIEKTAKQAAHLDAAEGRLAELEPQVQRATEEIDALCAEHAAVPTFAPVPDAPDLRAFDARASAAEDAARRAHSALAVAERQLAAAREAADRLAELDAERAKLERDLADLTRVAADLGRDGLQAMEIDAAGPELSAMINDLLHTCVSPRWTVTIDTTRLSADGKRQLEGLEVRVLDTERGREAPVETFSGGERVLIGEAVSLALAMLASRRAGMEGVTLVRDESGAALDPANARSYVAMLRRAADLVRASRVLLVSHAPEVVDLCDARVVVSCGKLEVQA